MEPYTIILQNKPLFWLGDKFYKVEKKFAKYTGDSVAVFEPKCPSCNGTRKITYKGYNGSDFECACPVCLGSIGHGYGDRMELNNWEVHEYIVYKISAQGPETMSAYKDGTGYMDSVSLTAFHKYGRNMDDYIQSDVPFVEDDVDPDIASIDMTAYYFRPKKYIFREKADAAKFCEALKKHDRKRLADFNEKYKTEHEYPF